MICFEVAYDELVNSSVRAGAQLLVVQTNNATFGHSGETYQQLAMTRLRAVEHARTVVQVATSGKSAIIDPDGRIAGRVRRAVHRRRPGADGAAVGLDYAGHPDRRRPPSGCWSALGLLALVVGGRGRGGAAVAAARRPATDVDRQDDRPSEPAGRDRRGDRVTERRERVAAQPAERPGCW